MKPVQYPSLPSPPPWLARHYVYTLIKRVVAAAAAFPPERNYHAAEQLGMTDGEKEGGGWGQMCTLPEMLSWRIIKVKYFA